MARCASAAATPESTPPESPQIARCDGPTVSRIFCTACSMKCAGVQSPVQPQTSNRKLWRISPPRGVWATSGWNSTPKIGRDSCRIAATGALGLDPITRKRGGGSWSLSPWLAHTAMRLSGSNPPNRPCSWASRIVTSARPYSRSGDGSTFPPDRCAISCIP